MASPRVPRGNCLNCRTILERYESHYCSVRGQQAYAQDRYVQAWLAGSVSGVNSFLGIATQSVRRYLFDAFRGCVVCGWAERNPTTGRIPLLIDHIDGDWRINRPENLRLLCPHHHALTSTYGALNRGKGRPYHVIKRDGALT